MLYQQSLSASDLEQKTNEELCRLSQNGNRDAEEILAARCHRLVRRIARPYFLAGGDSEDLLQEGMLAVVKAMREYSPVHDAAFLTFAEHCIRNRLFSVLKAANSGKHSPLNQAVPYDPSIFDANPVFAQDDPEVMLIDEEKTSLLFRLVCKQLSAFEIKVLEQYLKGPTCSEIAQFVGKPPKSVENAVQRIRRKAAQQLSSGDISRS